MSLAGLVPLITADPALKAVLGDSDGAELTVPSAVTPAVVAGLAQRRPVLAVTATTREADDLVDSLRSLLDPESVVDFPSWETLPHERLSPRSDTVGRRLAALRRLAHPDPDDPGAGPISVLVAPVRAVLQPLVSGLGDLEPVRLEVGDDVDLAVVVEQLADAGYQRVDLVERRGDFAVRGGILDVFPAV